jgi:hypothetical protein
LNELKKRVRVEEPPLKKIPLPVKNKVVLQEPVKKVPIARKSKSTQKIKEVPEEEALPKAPQKSKS